MLEDFAVQPLNGGRFLSRGSGRHPERIIDSDELIYVVSGVLELFEEQQLFRIQPGEWVILRRGRRHGGVTDYVPELSFFWLHFIDGAGMLEALPQHGRAARPERVTAACRNYLSEQLEREPDVAIQRLTLALIFRELQRSAAAPGMVAATPLALAAERVLKLHFTTATLHSVSRELKCNPEYLGRIYHLYFGETVSMAINRMKIEYAAGLLLERPLSVKEVMLKAGFTDPAYFRRRFAARFATTPGKFRQAYGVGHVNTV